MILFPFALLKRLSERWLAPQEDSDIAVKVGVFSGFLRKCLVLESRLIRHRPFPFGLSVIAVGKKNSRRRSEEPEPRSSRATE
jgi:hypothetical protein